MTEIKLIDGIKIGETVHKDVTLRDLTARDILEAHEAAERVVIGAQGSPVVVASPVRVGMETLRRRIGRLGNLQMPLSLAELLSLSERDLDILQDAVDEIEKAEAAGAFFSAEVSSPGLPMAQTLTRHGTSSPSS